MEDAPPVTVVIADGHYIYREGLARAVERHPGLLLERACRAGGETFEALIHYRPQVALLDVALPGMRALDICRRLQSTPDAPGIVLMSSEPNAELESAAETAGARLLLDKAVARERMCAALAALSG